MKQKILHIQTDGKGLYPFTSELVKNLELPKTGIINCFIQHTSASLVIQENADPTARKDLENFLERLIPDDDDWYEHTFEGRDDSTSHLRSSITATSLNIPIMNGRIGLGTWQGIYVWEHRVDPHTRNVVVTILE